MQFDRGYISPYFVTDPEKMEAVLEDAARPALDRKISIAQGSDPAARAGRQGGQAAAGRRRGRRGRGARHAGRQPAPRRAQELRRQGAGLRRPAQGDAPGHRVLTGGQVDLRGARHQAGERHARAARPRRARRGRQGHHHHHRRRAATRRRSKVASRRSAARSRSPPATTTARSSRSGWRSCGRRRGDPGRRARGSRDEGEEGRARRRRSAPTKAAVAEGIVPGGGLALAARAAVKAAEGAPRATSATGVRSCRARSRRRCARSPRSSAVDGGVVVDRMRRGTGNTGLTPPAHYVDLIEAGIIDPTKVVRALRERRLGREHAAAGRRRR